MSTLGGRQTFTGPSAAGMLPSSVQGGIYSVSGKGLTGHPGYGLGNTARPEP